MWDKIVENYKIFLDEVKFIAQKSKITKYMGSFYLIFQLLSIEQKLQWVIHESDDGDLMKVIFIWEFRLIREVFNWQMNIEGNQAAH